jgi:hypothetical protein
MVAATDAAHWCDCQIWEQHVSRTQNLRWKRKAIAVAAVAVSIVGVSAVGTASATDHGQWDCPDTEHYGHHHHCPSWDPEETWPDETWPDETWPDETTPEDTSAPTETDPETTEPETTESETTEPETTDVWEQSAPSPSKAIILRAGVASVSGSGMCVNGSGTINMTLSNTGGNMPITFVVKHPVSGASSTMIVASSSNQQVTLLGTPVGTVVVNITAGSTDLSRAFAIDCPLVDQPEQAVHPAIVSSANLLPATGQNSTMPTVFIAIGLLGAGSVALAFARRASSARHDQS